MKTSGMIKRIGSGLLVLAALTPAGAQEKPAAPESPADAIRAIRALFAQGRWGEGVQALEREERRQPDQDDLRFLRAMVTMEQGHHALAIRLYEQLLERYPDNPALKNNLAWLRVKAADPALRDLDRALREAQEAVMDAPRDYNIWNTLGEVRLARGDVMEAMRLAVLARDMATMAGERDLRVYQDLVRRCEAAPAKAQ